MRDLLIILISRTRTFWVVRSWTQRLSFYRRRAFFGFKGGFIEGREQTETLASLAWASKAPLLLSVSAAILLQTTNQYVPEITYVKIEKEAYSTFLATVAATGGVLIGLYYAATTAIAGSIYSQVPNNIRDLFARERVGSVYLRFLAMLTFTTLTLLAFQASGFTLIKIAPLLFTTLAGIAIVGFGLLGARAFNLFDPTTLSLEPLSQILKSVERCTPGNYRWLDPAFQDHARRIARTSLDSINTLAQICESGERLNGRPFVTFCRHQIEMLSAYTREKKKIPIDSKWYPVRYEYADWYWTEDTTTTLLYQTAGVQHPKEVTDSQWLESETLKIVQSCIRINASANRLGLATELIARLNLLTSTLCDEHQIDRAVDVVEALAKECAAAFFKSTNERAESLEQIALVDALCSLLINIYLSYRQAAVGLQRNNLQEKIRALRWRSKGEIYKSEFPQFCIPQLEWLRPRLDFEMKSEGNRITPDWYIEEIVRLSAVENAKKSFCALVDRIPLLFKQWAEEATQSKLHWVRAAILAREAEYWSKFNATSPQLLSRWKELNEAKRIEGLSWENLDLTEIQKKVDDRKKLLLIDMANSAITLAAIERPSNFPDFGGQFLHTIGERFLDACIENDAKTVEGIFPALFNGCLAQYVRLITKKNNLQSWQATTAAKIAVAPVLDLMHLTGYCMLFSERFENPELSKSILSLWDDYLKQKKEGATEVLKILAAAISITEEAFELAHRSIVRTNWNMRVYQALSDIPRGDEMLSGMLYGRVSHPIHPSALVRVFARERIGLHYDGIQVFIEKFVKNRPEAHGVEFTYRALDLGDAIKREEKRTAKAASKQANDD